MTLQTPDTGWAHFPGRLILECLVGMASYFDLGHLGKPVQAILTVLTQEEETHQARMLAACSCENVLVLIGTLHPGSDIPPIYGM